MKRLSNLVVCGTLLASCGLKTNRTKQPYVHYFLYKEKATNCQSILESDIPTLIGDEAGILLEEKTLNLPSGKSGKTYEYKNGLVLGKFSKLEDCNEFQKLYSKNF